MAKTRKRDTGETPRAFTGGSELNAPTSTQTESAAAAPVEGPTSRERERTGEHTESGEAWAPQSTGDTTAAAEDRDRIAARAYELYLERGGSGGDAMDDWLAAEREFSDRNSRDTDDRQPDE